MKAPLKFIPPQQDEFIKTLRKRVNQYLSKTPSHSYANLEMHIKTVVMLTLWIGTYSLIVFGNLPTALTFVLWGAQGVLMALVATNVGHDAIHGAYSKSKLVNTLLSHTFNLNGASAYMWTKMHNTAHHTYTNVHGYDEDIESLPIIRMSPSTEHMKIHKYQHWYSFFFYGLATISWVFIKDYVKFFKNDVGNFNNQKHQTIQYFYLFFYKFLNYVLFIALPLIMMDQAWWMTLLGFLLMHYCAGMYLAIVFMLAHVVEDTHFPVPKTDGSLENTWAIHQLYTTANFAVPSKLMFYLTGGLNLQVEHHLFPNVCSIHYPKIADIVRKTTKEFELPYIEYDTFGKAVVSHVRFMKKIGSDPNYLIDEKEQLKPAA